MGGEVLRGKCDLCGKEGPLRVKYRNFDGITCDCHGPYHFDRIEICQDCDRVPEDVLFKGITEIFIEDTRFVVSSEFLTLMSKQMKSLVTDKDKFDKLHNRIITKSRIS